MMEKQEACRLVCECYKCTSEIAEILIKSAIKSDNYENLMRNVTNKLDRGEQNV